MKILQLWVGLGREGGGCQRKVVRNVQFLLCDDIFVYPGTFLGDEGLVSGLAFVCRSVGGAVANGEKGVEGAGYSEPFWVVLESIPWNACLGVVAGDGLGCWWVFDEMLGIDGV